MKRLLTCFVLILTMVTLTACAGEKDSEVLSTDKVHSIYLLAADAGYEGTYEEWLLTVKGPQGESGEDAKEVILSMSETYIQWQYEGDDTWNDLIAISSLIGSKGTDGTNGINGEDGIDGAKGETGKKIEIQYSADFIQWKYENDSAWTNLMPISMLVGTTGLDGKDGEDAHEIQLQVNESTIQWKYEGELVWKDLIVYDSPIDDYYLTDNEINYFLDNYDSDMKALFPSIDMGDYDSKSFDNQCESDNFEACFTRDNYPIIYGEGYEKFMDKENSINMISSIMGTISGLMGDYKSEPIVPNNYLTGSDAFASVSGRNNTSALFEGALDGSIPVTIPVDVQFTYELLMYKSVEDNKIYIEGVIDFTGGAYFLEFSAFKTTFLLTYSMEKELETFIYSTDVVSQDEWVTIITTTDDGIEIYSTDTNAVEYFKYHGEQLEVVYSNTWYDETIDYSYELYENNQLVYNLTSEDGTMKYEIPLNYFTGWEKVEFNEDSKIGDNDFSYQFSLNDLSVLDGIITETELSSSPTWILKEDYKHFYYEEENMKSENANNVIILETSSRSDMISFIGDSIIYSQDFDLQEFLTVKDLITNYSYNEYIDSAGNVDEIFTSFNLR